MTTVPTVSPTELIRSSWGNTVATELNTKTVKTDGSMPVTGPLICQGNPPLRLRRTGDTPYVQFENTTGATRFGFVQMSSTLAVYQMDNAAGSHSFRVNNVAKLTVNNAGVTCNDALAVTGAATFAAAVTLPNADPTANNHAARKSYVDARVLKAGDTMTGNLKLGGGGGYGFSGVSVQTTGRADFTTSANISNLALNKISTAVTSGASYILFQKGTSGGGTVTTVGSISLNAALNGVNFDNATITLAADHPLRDVLDADDLATALGMLADRVVTLTARLEAVEAA